VRVAHSGFGSTGLHPVRMSFFFAAVASQIYYQWIPNNVALGIVMVGAPWLATKIVSALPTLWRVFRSLLARAFGQKRVYMSGTDMERPRR